MEDVYWIYCEPAEEDSSAQWRVDSGGMANEEVEAMGNGGCGVWICESEDCASV